VLNGNVVVLNFWATWCIPCEVGMPSLDRLAANLRDASVVVLPTAMDSAGAPGLAAFYA
jgi:thiol-disulfide isomerase/thioredoxin